MASFSGLKNLDRHATKVLERTSTRGDRSGQYIYREVNLRIFSTSVRRTANVVRSIKVFTIHLHLTYKNNPKVVATGIARIEPLPDLHDPSSQTNDHGRSQA